MSLWWCSRSCYDLPFRCRDANLVCFCDMTRRCAEGFALFEICHVAVVALLLFVWVAMSLWWSLSFFGVCHVVVVPFLFSLWFVMALLCRSCSLCEFIVFFNMFVMC